MRTVMHIEDNEAVYDAAGDSATGVSGAKIIDMTLTAKDGKIAVADLTNGKTYEGTYIVTKITPAGTDYSITLDGKSGYATVAMTTYADGSQTPTLPITLGSYSMYFYAE